MCDVKGGREGGVLSFVGPSFFTESGCCHKAKLQSKVRS